jgi:molybdate/tungstate transport system ATP-binding protein
MTKLDLTGIETVVGDFQLGPLDLTVEQEVVAVLGPSGSGKTTLLSVIAGIISPDTGHIVLNGTDIGRLSIENRGTVLMFQNDALFPHLTARENVEYAATSPKLIEQYIEMLDISDILGQYPPTLSGGERQRVALGRSLASDPSALLLDEPLSSLDDPIRRKLRIEMRDVLSSLSIPVVYVTHNRDEATVVGDKLAVMRDGRILQIDRPAVLYREPASPSVATFTGSDNVFKARVNNEESFLEWGNRRVRIKPAELTPDDMTWFSIRPEYVSIDPEPNIDNTYAATIVDSVLEGESYRITLALEDATSEPIIQATALPPVFEDLGLDNRDSIEIGFPLDAIHIMPVSNDISSSEIQD